MNLLARFLHRPQPARAADVTIARRIESERARKAAVEQQAKERAAALAKARTLGRVTVPLRPRDEIADDVRREREARKIPRSSAAPKEDGSGNGDAPDMTEGKRADDSRHYRTVQSIPAGHSEGRFL